MRMDTPLGRVMFVISLIVSVAMIASFWLVMDQPVVVKALLSIAVIAIAIWNGRLAYGAKATRSER
jgi:hypothetical protein